MSIHHKLDIYPEPEKVLYINEVAIADNTADQLSYDEEQPDNVRIYVPLDLNHRAIIRRDGSDWHTQWLSDGAE